MADRAKGHPETEATPEPTVADLAVELGKQRDHIAALEALVRRERTLREGLARDALRDLLARFQVRIVVAGSEVQLVAE